MIVRVWDAAKYRTRKAGDLELLQFESTEVPAPDDLIVIHGREWIVVRRIYMPPVLDNPDIVLVNLLVVVNAG